MQKNQIISEIYLNSKYVSKDSWLKLIQTISKYIGYFNRWSILIIPQINEIKYYIKSSCEIPIMFNDLEEFIFKKCDDNIDLVSSLGLIYFNDISANITDFLDKEDLKHNKKINALEIKIRAISVDKILSKGYVYFNKNNGLVKRKLLLTIPQNILSVDFSKNSRYFYKKSPKYLDIQKVLHLLKSDSNNAILKMDTFPYLQGNYYLNQNSYNFDKHSLVVGSSGSGKSKFLSLLINNLSSNLDYKLKYKVVVIDPHATLESDVGGLDNSKVIDFKSIQNSIDLFMNDNENIIASSELLMSLLKSLMADQYNSKLERVLRHSIHLLLSCEKFTFQNLRKLLLNTEYRNILVKELENYLPDSVIDFFLTDYNELKTRSYNEAVSPIISFIDEMQMIPIFNNKENLPTNLVDTISHNFLTIFSLDRVILGDKVIKTISGLIMQQVMQLIQTRKIDEHIILIVDEVSVIENPILVSFLSEARKYGLSIIIAQQYFDQISEKLKNAIFANAMNYYVFRVSQNDASILVDNISMKLSRDDTKEEKVKMLINLNDRECISRISSGGLIFPAFKAKTVDFVPIPRKRKIEVEKPTIQVQVTENNQLKKKFEINNTVSLTELLLNQSSSRRDMRGEEND